MRLLVTGGTGFVGRRLVRRLLRGGETVHTLARSSRSIAGATHHAADLGDADRVSAILREVEPHVVVHLAARTRPAAGAAPAREMHAALEDARNATLIADLASRCDRPPSLLLRAGSVAEYGSANGRRALNERDAERPRTPYGVGQLAATRALAALALPFPVVNARLGLVYGPGQDEGFLVPRLVAACLAGRPTHVRSPESRRDLVHVDDVVRALVAIVDRAPRDLPVVNVTCGRSPTMREVAGLVIDATGCDPDLVTFGKPAPDAHLCDPGLARRRLGWRAATTIERGIADMVDAVRGHRPNGARAASAAVGTSASRPTLAGAGS